MAYNRYQYETSPRKLEPEFDPYREREPVKRVNDKKQIKTSPNRKTKAEKAKKDMKKVMTVFALFAVLLTISYRESLINEKFKEVQGLKTNLAAVKKENEQLEVNIENSINLNNVEQAAKEQLGMQKLSNKQITYINLPKKDYVESATEEVVIKKDESIIAKLIDMFKK